MRLLPVYIYSLQFDSTLIQHVAYVITVKHHYSQRIINILNTSTKLTLNAKNT